MERIILVMTIVAVLFALVDWFLTWRIITLKKRYGFRIKETNFAVKNWVEQDGWVGTLGFIYGLELNVVVVFMCSIVTLENSIWFILLLAFLFGGNIKAAHSNWKIYQDICRTIIEIEKAQDVFMNMTFEAVPLDGIVSRGEQDEQLPREEVSSVRVLRPKRIKKRDHV